MTDPAEDAIGWENGYWYDEPINVDNSDGLNSTELEIVVARSMARVEILRGAEFKHPVSVNVQSREEYRQSTPFGGADKTHSDWNNQVWESLFIVDENSNISTEMETFYGGGVLGYYASNTGELVIISDSPNSLSMSEATLVHELVHALQDQRFDLGNPTYTPITQDEQLASNGLIEGEAKYIENKYRENCGSDWSCLPEPASSNPSDGNLGIHLTIYQPYADGEEYIAHLIQTGGWEAVDAAFETPPTRTAEIIHPGSNISSYAFEPLPRQQNGWTTFESVGDDGADSVGETSVFVMMWYQNYAYHINTIPQGSIRDAEGKMNYEHTVSEGLVADRVTPYKNGEKRGYIWRLQWETEADATEFTDMYKHVLRGHGANHVADSTWVIPSGGYADAFHIEQAGQTVTITNAPSEDDLHTLRPATSLATNQAPSDGAETRGSGMPDMRTIVVGGIGVGGAAFLIFYALRA